MVNYHYSCNYQVQQLIELNLFAVLFWALGIVLGHILQQVTQPAGFASLYRGTGTVLYGMGQLGSTC